MGNSGAALACGPWSSVVVVIAIVVPVVVAILVITVAIAVVMVVTIVVAAVVSRLHLIAPVAGVIPGLLGLGVLIVLPVFAVGTFSLVL